MLNGITTRDGRVLDRGVGLTKKTLLVAINSLEEQDIVLTERRQSESRGNEATRYSLNVASALGGEITPPLAEKVHQGGGVESTPSPRGRNYATQERVEQETAEQDFYISNIRKGQPGRGDQEASVASRNGAPPAGAARGTEAEAVGDVIARSFARAPRSRPRPETETDEYQRIQALIADRAREFIDTAPLKSSTTRAWNLYHRAGVSIGVFESKIFQAKALTLESTARITKTAEVPGLGGRRKSKMAYFFATLEDQLNLLTPEERARRGGPGEASKGVRRGRPAKPKTSGEEPTTVRKPDSEGPYGAYIKS